MEGEGDSPVNLAEAAAHVLLEALHMHCQQGRTPAHHNGCVNTTTHLQVKSHNNGQVSTVTKYGAINGIIGQELDSALLARLQCNGSYAWVLLVYASHQVRNAC